MSGHFLAELLSAFRNGLACGRLISVRTHIPRSMTITGGFLLPGDDLHDFVHFCGNHPIGTPGLVLILSYFACF